MKKIKGMKSTAIVAALTLIAVMAMPSVSLAAQDTVNLGTTSTYAVLAGSAITNTGTTVIEGSVGGDIGLYPGTAYTGGETVTVSGSVHLADAEAIQAKDDLVNAYDDATGRTPVITIPTELGGSTLTPGVYDSADGTFQITGTLTLDAQGDPEAVFIFKTASTLITATGSDVELINSARFCRTFWAVGSSATLGNNSDFAGHILAMVSITANSGANIQGQLLARNGAVTLNNNTINNGICEVETPVNPSSGTTTTPAITTAPAITTTPAITTVAAITTDSGITTTSAVEAVESEADTTINGGQLPDTSGDLYNLLLLGAALILMGGIGLQRRKKNENL